LAKWSYQFSEAIFPAVTTTVPYPEATNITVGDAYYGAAKFFPPSTYALLSSRIFSLSYVYILIDIDTRVTWGLNLGQNNLTAAFLEARALVQAFASPPIKNASIVLEAIEIGNEADLYAKHGARPSTFTSTQYVAECVLISNI
jgi:hypothetical protein